MEYVALNHISELPAEFQIYLRKREDFFLNYVASLVIFFEFIWAQIGLMYPADSANFLSLNPRSKPESSFQCRFLH